MHPISTTTVTLPGYEQPVVVEAYGEHHMGADHVEIVTPFPIEGISRFYTTNGRAYFSPFTHSLVIHDACTILQFDLQTQQLSSLLRPAGWYFSGVREDADAFHFSLYTGSGKHREQIVRRDEASFLPGFGDVSAGVFPSAYMSYATSDPRFA